MQPIETVGGVEIHLTEDHKFEALIGGKRTIRTSIAAIKKAIMAGPSLRFHVISYSGHEYTITGVKPGVRNRATTYFDEDGRKISHYNGFFFPNDTAKHELESIASREVELYDKHRANLAALEAERCAIVAALERLTPEHFNHKEGGTQ